MAARPPVVVQSPVQSQVAPAPIAQTVQPVPVPAPAAHASQSAAHALAAKGGQMGVGVAPPPGAPYEVAAIPAANDGGFVTADGQILTPQILAAQHERSLAPLTYGNSAATAPAAQAGGVREPAPVQAAGPAPSQSTKPVQPAATAHQAQSPRPVLQAGGPGAQVAAIVRGRPDPASNQPAASNTDSPSRGIPRQITDLGKQITGGFGDAAGAQYFPLDGSEVLKVVWLLMDDLAKRLTNDLRFSPAITYPRVGIKIALTVDGYPEDQGFRVERAGPVHDRTPVEFAEQLADEVIFVVKSERREFAKSGESQTPANAMRAEIGVVAPRKQFVGVGNARQVADVVVS